MKIPLTDKPLKHVLIVSSCSEPWGGSEELWNNLAHHMLNQNIRLSIFKDDIELTHPKINTLKETGAKFYYIKNTLGITLKILYLILTAVRIPFVDKYKSQYLLNKIFRIKGLKRCLKKLNPDYIIISQGINYDGMDYAWLCLNEQYKYSIICQKVIEASFLNGKKTLEKVRKSYLKAHHVFFVSKHNKVITEEQIASKLNNSHVVLNPNKFQDIELIPATNFSNEEAVFLCIGRFYISEKGQDILVRILNQPKWRQRPFKVYLIGSGMDKELIAERIQFYNLKNIEFKSYSTNLLEDWKHAQGLILPSRHEGLPLVLLEAMSLGKICIIGNAGGSNEIVEDSINGFIGDPTTVSFDAAMERAWQQRENWDTISENAKQKIKSIYNNTKPYQVVFNTIVND